MAVRAIQRQQRRSSGKVSPKQSIRPCGGFWSGDDVSLVVEYGKIFGVLTSRDGKKFHPKRKRFRIRNTRGAVESLCGASGFKFSRLTNGAFFLSYKKGRTVWAASSPSGALWKKIGSVPKVSAPGCVAGELSGAAWYAMYFGRGTVHLAVSPEGTSWKARRGAVLSPRPRHFDSGPLEPMTAFVDGNHIAVAYLSHTKRGACLGLAMMDAAKPDRLVWRADAPLWETPAGVSGRVFAVVRGADSLILFFEDGEGRVASARVALDDVAGFVEQWKSPALTRFHGNPILQAIASHPWESKATFNPTAVHDDGKVHIVYRAIGDSDQSVLGYASSRDGVHVDERLAEPIYVPREAFEGAALPQRTTSVFHLASLYMSGGGGAGGCEDPRLTRLGDRYYMTYVAYDGGGPPRVALTSISREDFLNKRWNWAQPVLISAPNVVNKNACIFPEMINGKYVILHRVFPNIQLDFVNSLDFDGATWLETKAEIPVRETHWDSRKLGAGASPLKTDEGWLLIYQGVDERDAGRYKIGAMLLGLNDPRQVLARSRNPILEPEAHYENSGYKGGVVYPCGAVVVGDTLLVYYGAGDNVACVATAPFREFVRKLKANENPRLEPFESLTAPLEAEGIFTA